MLKRINTVLRLEKVRGNNMNEDEVCILLKNWFEIYDIECWLNKGENKFTTKKSQKKPDILIYSKKINQFIAIEVKRGEDKNGIRNSAKIIDYLEDYVNTNIEYYIPKKKEKINISSFCIATQASMNGKIFLDDIDAKDSFKDKNTPWGEVQLKYNLEPRWEYVYTKEFLRNLWANWRRVRKKEYQPGMGIILSDILNWNSLENNEMANPLLFDMQWRLSFRNKKQWRQNNFLL